MRRASRLLLVAGAAVAALAPAGCGLGEGEGDGGEAHLSVTRDYGTETVLSTAVADPPASQTVLRLLDSEAEIETRYGGGFVHSIEGIAGGVETGRSRDWFFYVNGVESSVGAAEVPVGDGDRIWWDHHDWTDVMRVPAVVGSWPEPFAQASTPAAEREKVVVDCQVAGSGVCDEVVGALASEGVEATFLPRVRTGPDREPAVEARSGGPRVLVGPWAELSDDPAAGLLADGPESSGVFAEPNTQLGELTALDVRGREAARLGPGSGLVAAVRDGEDPPTWLVTGSDDAGVEAAAELLDAETLADRYAVATFRGEPLPLPVDPEASR